MAVWGSPVSFFNAIDPPRHDVQASFDERYREVRFDSDGAEVVTTRPVLGMRTASFPPGRLPAQGDLFGVKGILYVVSAPPEADGHGHLKVALRLATDEEARRVPSP